MCASSLFNAGFDSKSWRRNRTGHRSDVLLKYEKAEERVISHVSAILGQFGYDCDSIDSITRDPQSTILVLVQPQKIAGRQISGFKRKSFTRQNSPDSKVFGFKVPTGFKLRVQNLLRHGQNGEFIYRIRPLVCKRQYKSGTKTLRIRHESGTISSYLVNLIIVWVAPVSVNALLQLFTRKTLMNFDKLWLFSLSDSSVANAFRQSWCIIHCNIDRTLRALWLVQNLCFIRVQNIEKACLIVLRA